MRRAVPIAAAGCLLAGPTALAFFSGGYYTQPRLIAAIVAWLLVAALALAGTLPLPRTVPGWLAVGGLAAVSAWSAISVAWAPLGGPAIDNVERLVLYVGALLAAIGALRLRGAARAVEPVLAAGATLVIAYGLSGRLLPGIVHLAHSKSAGGRLEQPITYWNGEGALAAVGLVLCARLAGDGTRPAWMRMLAGAAAAPLGAGVYLSYSRGAIAVALLGLVTIVAAAPTRAQLRAAVAALVVGVAASVAAAAFGGVASLEGTDSQRIRDGAIALALLVLIAAAGAAYAVRLVRTIGDGALPWGRWPHRVAAAAIVAVVAGLVIGGISERPSQAELATGANATRLTTVNSNRYEYWRVALRAFGEHPLAGLGSGGFRVYWLEHRSITETVRDTHSLEFEMAAELGLVGLLAFLVMVAGVVASALRAMRTHPGIAAGWAVGTLVWFLHASIDWDWQLPAVSLPAIVMAGALIALAESRPGAFGAEAQSSSAIRGASRRNSQTARTHTATAMAIGASSRA